MPFADKSPNFPLSYKKAVAQGFVMGKDNPLSILNPNEAAAAELFALCRADPRTAKTMPAGPERKWGVLRSGAFGTAFRETFGFDINSHVRKCLELNMAWRAYVEQLRTQTRAAVMDKLKQDALAAYHDYTWSRTEARAQGDYKETRVASADHLDRIGATEKADQVTQNVVVVLRGRNFTEDTLNRELPETTFELVVPATEVEVT